MSPVPSPCNNECITDGEICTGCGRTIEEIANWSRYSEEQKRKIVERVCPSLLVDK